MSESGESSTPRSMYGGIFLSSVGVLMLQILLTRIFSFTIWYHLAYLTISAALMGFGAAGTILSSFPRLWKGAVARFSALSAAGAGIGTLGALMILGSWPLDPLKMTTDPWPFFAALFCYYLILWIPFVLAGLAVAAPLSAYPFSVNRLYAVDLLGAGLGCLAAVAALMWLDGSGAVAVCIAVFFSAAAVYAERGALANALRTLTVASLLFIPFSENVLDFRPSPSKALGRALTLESSKILHTEWSPVNRVDIVREKSTMQGFTFWGGIGINPQYSGFRPGGHTILYDGHNGSTIYNVDEGQDSMRMLDQHILRAPYFLHDNPEVLVIGVGGGIDVLNAVRRNAKHVTAVELQPITVALHNGLMAEWTGGVFQRSDVSLVAAEGRHHVRSHDDTYDVIQITMVDTFSAQATGAYVLAESYLYTVEAFDDYFEHLNEHGAVSFVLGDLIYDKESIPPAMATRLALSARSSLGKLGIADAAPHMLYLSVDVKAKTFARPGSRLTFPENSNSVEVLGMTLGSLIVKKSPFTEAELFAIRNFAVTNGFRTDLMPDKPAITPMAKLIRTPDDELIRALDEQLLVMTPATDDVPFFFHLLRWRSLLTGERVLWSHPGSTTGQLVLLMMLLQSIILGTVLIILPLLLGAREGLPGKETVGFLLYFLSLGVGFMLIEISFVQKYVLLLGYPTYSLSVTVFSLLVFAALGAALSKRFWNIPSRFLLVLLTSTIALVISEVLIMPIVRDLLLGSPMAVRILATVLLQLPLGTCLGMYFTTGIEILRNRSPRLIPWAWAINAVGSVLSTVVAVMLAMTIGFSGVALTALVVYAIGVASLLTVVRRGDATG